MQLDMILISWRIHSIERLFDEAMRELNLEGWKKN